MAKGRFLAFMAGAAAGAAAVLYALSDKGAEKIQTGCDCAKKGLKKVEEVLDRISEEEKEEDTETEEK